MGREFRVSAGWVALALCVVLGPAQDIRAEAEPAPADTPDVGPALGLSGWMWSFTGKYKPSKYLIPDVRYGRNLEGWCNLFELSAVAQKGDWFISPLVQLPLDTKKGTIRDYEIESYDIDFDLVAGRSVSEDVSLFVGWRGNYAHTDSKNVSRTGYVDEYSTDAFSQGPLLGISYSRSLVHEDIWLYSELRLSPYFSAESRTENRYGRAGAGDSWSSDSEMWFMEVKLAINYKFAPGCSAGVGVHARASDTWHKETKARSEYGPMVQFHYCF